MATSGSGSAASAVSSSTWYTTLAKLKTRISVTDTTDDSELERIITAVSRAIDAYCSRRFYASSETRYYTATRSNRLMVDDLVSVTNLYTDEDGDRTYEATWATTDFDLTPDNAALDGNPYWAIEVTPEGDYSFPVDVRKGVKIVGSFGFPATSPQLSIVEDACLAQCKIEFDARSEIAGVDGTAPSPAGRVSLHPFVKALLDPLRNVSVA